MLIEDTYKFLNPHYQIRFMSLPIRKIEPKEESERKRKRNTLVLSVIMISLLLFSTAGYSIISSVEDNSQTSKSNNLVENVGGSWIINYGGQTISLSNSPESGQNVNISFFGSLQNYNGKTLYVAAEDADFYEIYNALSGYADRVQRACYGDCTKNLPEKDCNETMIVVKSLDGEANVGEGKIYEDNNCVFIEGGSVAVDAFLYRLFGAA